MRGFIRGAVSAGWLAAVLAAGCSAGAPARYQATAGTCFAFGKQALQRHITVTAVPRACAGLSHAQVNLAMARAIREAVGPQHKVAARRLAATESAYLAHLIVAVPPPGSAPPPGTAPPGTAPPGTAPLHGPAGQAVAPARKPVGLAFRLTALAAWIVTAAAGSYLLAGWLAPAGSLRSARAAGRPPAIVVSHVALAVAGLGIWIAFVAAGLPVLAWIGLGLIVPAGGLGMAALAAALPEPAASAGLPGMGLPPSARLARTAAPGRAPMPVIVIALHGALATATILLVLLAASGAG
jgi:hypothetical protein